MTKSLTNKTNRKETLDWDENMTEGMRDKWNRFFIHMFDLEELKFPRCVQPGDSIGNPVLIIYSDGSMIAYGTCAYIRWELTNGDFETRLLAAKNRIAPAKQLSVPRLELCGAVLASRLRIFIESEMDFNFEKIVHLTDSMIVRAQIQKESYGFGTFVATRIAEIQQKTDPTEWWWVSTDHNPADLTTRITLPNEIGENSTWQRGPEYLRSPIDMWPIRQDCKIEANQLPDRVGITMTANVQSAQLETDISFEDVKVGNVNDYNKLMKVTSLILSIAKARSFKGMAGAITLSALKRAEVEWIRYAQLQLRSGWKVRFRRLGPYINNEGLIVVGSRMANWLRNTWNSCEFILLPGDCEIATLYVKLVHERDHAGVDVTVAKVRGKFWIPRLRKIVKRIKNQCITCRKRDKQLIGQQMGTLPLERLLPSPAFYYCAVDLFGPFVIKDAVKRRTRGKAYGVLFNCLSSRAVYVDVAEGYDTESFVLVLRRFVSLRGYPRKMRSDPGTQLVATGKELKQMIKGWNWQEIKSFGGSQGMEWEINKSADAPWENGCSEALIKSVKRGLLLAVGSAILTFSELQTVMFETANLVNERPIGMKSDDPNRGSYLCPNDLILGRSSIRVPNGPWSETRNIKLRFALVQQIVDQFWKRWQRDYFLSLIIRQKWHTSKRNLQVGDIVLLQDSNTVRGNWKLAQVSVANPGNDGNVRDVTVRYKNSGSGKEYHGKQDVHVTRSAHRIVLLLPVQ